ncbi:acyl-CoA transferase [Halioxenophilus aromaticivorans]|uniref:Acyl-CoA transferase n=1 Tax=Halioxenophilus aromaticivorans TaxID=1306992 RepID=A0AAV3U286_9ALTE
MPLHAQYGVVTSPIALEQGANYLARIGQNDPEELGRALDRIEQLFMVESAGGDYEPVVIVLHGPEVAVFQRQNYHQFKHIVDRAARLSAFNVVDIRVCETRLDVLGGAVDALVPFIGTVPYGPAEIERLTGAGYLHF